MEHNDSNFLSRIHLFFSYICHKTHCNTRHGQLFPTTQIFQVRKLNPFPKIVPDKRSNEVSETKRLVQFFKVIFIRLRSLTAKQKINNGNANPRCLNSIEAKSHCIKRFSIFYYSDVFTQYERAKVLFGSGYKDFALMVSPLITCLHFLSCLIWVPGSTEKDRRIIEKESPF